MAIIYNSGRRVQGTSTDVAVIARGTVDTTSSSGNTIITFTGDGTFTPTSAFNIEYLVVAGGGSGGTRQHAGGGGAGGYRTNVGGTALGVTAQTYVVTVGAGGLGNTTEGNLNGTSGSNSSIVPTSGTSIISTGGGRGGAYGSTGATGGSGGGGGATGTAGGSGNSGSYSPVEGYAGGSGGGTDGSGGGGGGAGSIGIDANTCSGGGGLNNSITGSSVGYAGGGGGSIALSGGQGTTSHGANSGANPANNADTNTGAGGSGGGNDTATNYIGGNGGSGIVIIKFSTSGNTYDIGAGGKPANVQVGSRYEETDTRKMYHYADNSTKGLKAYYRFEDNGTNSQTTGDGLGSTANITLSGNTSYTTGKVGSKALSFDGNQDYAQAGTSLSQFNFMHNTTHEFTASFWLKRDGDNANGGGQGSIWTTANNIGASWYGMCIRRNGTNAMFVAFAAGTNQNRVQQEQTGYSTDGGWHHIVVTAKASDSTNSLEFWQDGVSLGSYSNTGKVFSDTNATCAPVLGGNNSNNEQDFNGDLDNLNIWNRRLSDDEISTLYNGGTGIVLTDGMANFKAWSEEGT